MIPDFFIKLSDFVSLIAGWIIFYYVLKKIHVNASIKEYTEQAKSNNNYNEEYYKEYYKLLNMQCICTTGGFILITVLGKYVGFLAVLIASVLYTFLLVKVLKKKYPELQK